MKKRIVLFHWHPQEVQEKKSILEDAGYQVDAHWSESGEGARASKANPPDAFVIDLSRLPSQGKGAAIYLRQTRTTREIPLVFVGGVPEKVARVRKDLPDATFTEWRVIRSAIKKAMAKPSAKLVIPPDTMTGYSGTPLPKKLGIKAGYSVALLGGPKDFKKSLGALPEKVTIKTSARGACDLVVLFLGKERDLEKRFATVAKIVKARGVLWLAWPKRASGIQTDITQSGVRAYGLSHGWVDFKICAIDGTWSGLAFVRRKS